MMFRKWIAISSVLSLFIPCLHTQADNPFRGKHHKHHPHGIRGRVHFRGKHLDGHIHFGSHIHGFGFHNPYSYLGYPYRSSTWIIRQPVYVPQPVYIPQPVIIPQQPANIPNQMPQINPPQKPAAPQPKPADPIDQMAKVRQALRKGNEAFTNMDYQSAQRHYRQAVEIAPNLPKAYFYLGQAYLALEKYDLAIASLQKGLRLHPRWPLAGFQPSALYGKHIGNYHDHLARLAKIVEKNLNDDALLFLLGYQLWFDGRQDEANVLFKRAAALAFDNTYINYFLRARELP